MADPHTAETIKTTATQDDVVDSAAYLDQLQQIASTDQIPEGSQWPTLRAAIKQLITKNIAAFPRDPPPLLHPAARAIPSTTQYHPDTDSSFGSNPGNGMRSQPLGSGMPPTSQATGLGSIGLANSFTAAGAAMLDNSSFGPLGGGFTDSSQHPQGNGDLSFNTDSIDYESLGIAPGDLQSFYPSRKPPPLDRGGAWGTRYDESQVENHTKSLFLMLDEFEDSPPFTIQRLAELSLHPTAHYHTHTKYMSALRRVLAVTATHSSFPVEPSAADLFLDGMNLDNRGVLGQPTAPGLSAVMPGAMTPHPSSMLTGGAGAAAAASPLDGSGSVGRSRSSSVSSASSSLSSSSSQAHIHPPLFSPIPFLARQEAESDGLDGSGGVLLRDVPDMELGGADRTHADRVDGMGAGEAGGALARPTSDLQSAQEPSVHDPQSPAGNQAVPPVPMAMSPSTGSSGGSTTSTAPLGVPRGRVDELDAGAPTDTEGPAAPGGQEGGSTVNDSTPHRVDGPGDPPPHPDAARGKLRADSTMRPLSSTTTVSPSKGTGESSIQVAPSAEGNSEATSAAGQGDAEREEAEGRQTKRPRRTSRAAQTGRERDEAVQSVHAGGGAESAAGEPTAENQGPEREDGDRQGEGGGEKGHHGTENTSA